MLWIPVCLISKLGWWRGKWNEELSRGEYRKRRCPWTSFTFVSRFFVIWFVVIFLKVVSVFSLVLIFLVQVLPVLKESRSSTRCAANPSSSFSPMFPPLEATSFPSFSRLRYLPLCLYKTHTSAFSGVGIISWFLTTEGEDLIFFPLPIPSTLIHTSHLPLCQHRYILIVLRLIFNIYIIMAM